MLWAGIFLRALVIPWLQARGALGKPISVSSVYSGAVVVDRKRIYKIALSRKSTIDVEYKKYVKAGQRWPELIAILPDCQFQEEQFFSYLAMTRYHPIGMEEAIVQASNLYQFMRFCRTPNVQTMAISDSEELGAGLEVILNLYDDSTSRAVYQQVETYLRSGDYHLGFVHGDFHSRNIMIDEHGKPRLIDLDCIRLNGIQELDALYFVLELEWSRSGKLWYLTMVDFLKGNIPADLRTVLNGFDVENSFPLCITFLVDRIGQEAKVFGLDYTRRMLDPAIDEIKFRR